MCWRLKEKRFLNTIKPYFSKNTGSNKCKIVLNEEGSLLTETSKVAETFNEFFIHVADNIGKDFDFNPENHPSVTKIKEVHHPNESFKFDLVDCTDVNKIIRKMNARKAVGVDRLSVKLLKAGRESLVPFLTDIVNQSLKFSIFPDRLKESQVTPLFKKNDPLDKKNYHTVSVLNNVSKIFERVMCDQLVLYFDNLFNDFLCAFRKGLVVAKQFY